MKLLLNYLDKEQAWRASDAFNLWRKDLNDGYRHEKSPKCFNSKYIRSTGTANLRFQRACGYPTAFLQELKHFHRKAAGYPQARWNLKFTVPITALRMYFVFFEVYFGLFVARNNGPLPLSLSHYASSDAFVLSPCARRLLRWIQSSRCADLVDNGRCSKVARQDESFKFRFKREYLSIIPIILSSAAFLNTRENIDDS